LIGAVVPVGRFVRRRHPAKLDRLCHGARDVDRRAKIIEMAFERPLSPASSIRRQYGSPLALNGNFAPEATGRSQTKLFWIYMTFENALRLQ
jgi:hypothetical protein